MHGTDAPNLRKIAIRILSQTASSSGCERNWSTFALIHTKVRNRLNYDKLEKLVFAQYNMRLKLKHIIKEHNEQGADFKAIDLTKIFEEYDGISEWLDDPGDALLDELDEDTGNIRPNTYLATFANRWSDSQTTQLNVSGKQPNRITTDEEFENLMRGSTHHGFSPTADVDEESDDDTDTDTDTGDGGEVGGENVISTNRGGERSHNSPGMVFTSEQGFQYCTEDTDHGYRPFDYNRPSDNDVEMQDVEELASNFSSLNTCGCESNRFGYTLSSSARGQSSGHDSSSSAHNYGSLYSSSSQVDWRPPTYYMEDFEKFKRDYDNFYCSYKTWINYCDYVEKHYQFPLRLYPSSGFLPPRHSTAN